MVNSDIVTRRQVFSARELCVTAVMTALVFLATFVPRIPIPLGYAHLGDAVIFLLALLLIRRSARCSTRASRRDSPQHRACSWRGSSTRRPRCSCCQLCGVCAVTEVHRTHTLRGPWRAERHFFSFCSFDRPLAAFSFALALSSRFFCCS